jgi:hypothetical protein
MFIVICNDEEKEFSRLTLAMDYAKMLDKFVTIKGDEFEVVGMFGVDSIVDGKCPDGIDYTWMKRRNS